MKTLESNHLFETVDSITIRVFEDNLASVKLIEKIGFEREGRLKNAVKSFDNVVHNDLLYSLEKIV